MSKEIYADNTKEYIFSTKLDEWIGKAHPARFIKEFVHSINLNELGFSTRNRTTGRPAYSD